STRLLPPPPIGQEANNKQRLSEFTLSQAFLRQWFHIIRRFFRGVLICRDKLTDSQRDARTRWKNGQQDKLLTRSV
ncbi:unnamed protein product, partial [Brassica rapa subsp. trilocularis]